MQQLNGRNRNIIRRRARKREPLPSRQVKIQPPKQLPQPPAKPNYWALLPTIVMALAFGGITFFVNRNNPAGSIATLAILPMMLMGLMMMAVQFFQHRGAKKAYAVELEAQQRRYQAHLGQTADLLQKLAHEQRQIMWQENPSLSHLAQLAAQRAKTLWERQPTDDDFLALRIGTSSLPICVDVQAPEPNDEDGRLEQVQTLVEENALVPQMPLLVNLNRLGSVGVRGQNRSEALYLAFTIIANIVVHHSPDEVQIYLFSHRPGAGKVWHWLRWLPHTATLHKENSDAGRISLSPETSDAVITELSRTLRQRGDKERRSEASYGQREPHLVIVFDQASALQGHHAISRLLAHTPHADRNELRASVLFVDFPIPPQVNAMIEVQGKELAYRETWTADANQARRRGLAEPSNPKEMHRLARSLAPLRTEESMGSGSGALPSSVRLVELLGAASPDEVNLKRLYRESYDPKQVMTFPIGLDSDLRTLNLILREQGQGGHGSHAMLAGMTGTGKSVMLQAMVLSMALTNSPRHLNFVLADFKGGASELAKLQDLPHVVGFVTDLDTAMVERFRIALESEVVRRQTLFDTSKERLGSPVANIRSYNRLQPNDPLPHLVVLLDEFAHGLSINSNLRNAMDRIAAQGRALGVHLILSTQRASDFDNKIRPNIDIRLSLRVASAADSKTMFNRAEAHTQLTKPGQAFVQVGDNEIFERFQAARADIADQSDGDIALDLVDDFSIFRIGRDGQRHLLYKHQAKVQREEDEEETALSEAEVLVARVADYCNERYPAARLICLPPLPEALDLPLLPFLARQETYRQWTAETGWANGEARQRLRVPLGMLDLPAEQAQRPFLLDLNERDGNMAVIGPSGAGKSLFLRSLVLALASTHSPDDFHIYILGRGPSLAVFKDLPHCGGVIQATETERINRLFTFLQATVRQRRAAMGREQVSSMADLRQQTKAARYPAMMLIIEDFAGFKSEQEEALSIVQTLAGDAQSVDMHLVLASTAINTINIKILDNISQRLALGLKQSVEYFDVLGQRAEVLQETVGRGYTTVEQAVLECQIAAPAAEAGIQPASQTAAKELREVVEAMQASWQGALPKLIEILPKQIHLNHLWQEAANTSGADVWQRPVAKAYETLQPVAIDLERLESPALVVGPPGSGKSVFLSSLCLASLATMPAEQLDVVVLTAGRNRLGWLRRVPNVVYANNGRFAQQALTDLCNRLRQQAEQQRVLQEQAEDQTLSLEIEQLGKRTLLIIDDLQRFMRLDAGLAGLVDQCMEQGRDVGLTILLADTGNNFAQARSLFNVKFVQAGLKSGCGIVFSTDQKDLALLGLEFKVNRAVVKQHGSDIGQGRGFLKVQGQDQVVQIGTLCQPIESETACREQVEAFIAQQNLLL